MTVRNLTLGNLRNYSSELKELFVLISGKFWYQSQVSTTFRSGVITQNVILTFWRPWPLTFNLKLWKKSWAVPRAQYIIISRLVAIGPTITEFWLRTHRYTDTHTDRYTHTQTHYNSLAFPFGARLINRFSGKWIISMSILIVL